MMLLRIMNQDGYLEEGLKFRLLLEELVSPPGILYRTVHRIA